MKLGLPSASSVAAASSAAAMNDSSISHKVALMRPSSPVRAQCWQPQ
jgi:hypothetical protein